MKMTFPLTPSLSSAFAEAASRRQAPGEREIYRGINFNPLPLDGEGEGGGEIIYFLCNLRKF